MAALAQIGVQTTWEEAHAIIDQWKEEFPDSERVVLILDAPADLVVTATGAAMKPTCFAGLCYGDGRRDEAHLLRGSVLRRGARNTGGGVSARVFIHPRCLSGPALGALQAALEERGYDMDKIAISPPGGHSELVRLIGEDADGTKTLERFDGVRFTYNPNTKEAA